MNPEFDRIVRQAGVNPNVFQHQGQSKQLPRPNDSTPRIRRRFSNKKFMGGGAQKMPSPLHVGPLEEIGTPAGRITALKNKGFDEGLKLIYDWTITKSIDFKEFEDLMAEFTSKLFKQIR